MDYTICLTVLETAKNEKRYIYDLLFPFMDSHNTNKVVKSVQILESYEKIADVDILTWIDGLTHQNFWKNIDCCIGDCDDIYIAACRQTNDKRLIVSEKEEYCSSSYDSLKVFDMDEAIKQFEPNTTIIHQYINGNNNKTTAGHDSPNIN